MPSDKIIVHGVPHSKHLHRQLFRDRQFVDVSGWWEDPDVIPKQDFVAPIMYGSLSTTPGFLLRDVNPRSKFLLADDLLTFIPPEDAEEPGDPESGDIVIAPLDDDGIAMIHAMAATWVSIFDTNILHTPTSIGRYGNSNQDGHYLATDPIGLVCPYVVRFVSGDEEIDPGSIISAIATSGSGSSGFADITYESDDGPVTISVAVIKDPETDSVDIDALDFPHSIGVRQAGEIWYFNLPPF